MFRCQGHRTGNDASHAFLVVNYTTSVNSTQNLAVDNHLADSMHDDVLDTAISNTSGFVIIRHGAVVRPRLTVVLPTAMLPSFTGLFVAIGRKPTAGIGSTGAQTP